MGTPADRHGSTAERTDARFQLRTSAGIIPRLLQAAVWPGKSYALKAGLLSGSAGTLILGGQAGGVAEDGLKRSEDGP